MALDTSNISQTAKDALTAGAFGKFRSLSRTVVASFQTILSNPTYYSGVPLPLIRSKYPGATNEDIQANYFANLNDILGTRDFGIFSHDGDKCYYAVVKNLAFLHKFSVLYKSNDSDQFSTFIETQTASDFYYASTGPFQPLELKLVVGSTPGPMGDPIFIPLGVRYWPGTFYKDNTRYEHAHYKTGVNSKIQFNGNGGGQLVIIDGLEADGGDGFSTVIQAITPGLGVSKNTTFNAFKSGDNKTDGCTIFAFDSVNDIIYSVVRSDGEDVDIEEILETLYAIGATRAVYCDGNDSAFLYDYEIKKWLINGLDWSEEDNGLGWGLRICYAIKKTQ